MTWVMSALTVYSLWLAGDMKRGAWVVGLLNQGLWLVFIVTREEWGLLPMNVALWFVNARNLGKWLDDGGSLNGPSRLGASQNIDTGGEIVQPLPAPPTETTT